MAVLHGGGAGRQADGRDAVRGIFGHDQPPPGRPKAAAAPSGGSVVHKVTSVGAMSMRPS